jgi:hypothetical protein
MDRRTFLTLAVLPFLYPLLPAPAFAADTPWWIVMDISDELYPHVLYDGPDRKVARSTYRAASKASDQEVCCSYMTTSYGERGETLAWVKGDEWRRNGKVEVRLDQ